MRISGGTARGIPIKTTAGNTTRPATDRMREAVFSSLGPGVRDAVFLDLFAGSGAYGLEALSRGAARGTFVEKNPACIACIKANLHAVCRSADRSPEDFQVTRADVLKFSPAMPPNLIFLDPPYHMIKQMGFGFLQEILHKISHTANTRLVFELPAGFPASCPDLTVLKRLGKPKGPDAPSVVIFGLDAFHQ